MEPSSGLRAWGQRLSGTGGHTFRFYTQGTLGKAWQFLLMGLEGIPSVVTVEHMGVLHVHLMTRMVPRGA